MPPPTTGYFQHSSHLDTLKMYFRSCQSSSYNSLVSPHLVLRIHGPKATPCSPLPGYLRSPHLLFPLRECSASRYLPGSSLTFFRFLLKNVSFSMSLLHHFENYNAPFNPSSPHFPAEFPPWLYVPSHIIHFSIHLSNYI